MKILAVGAHFDDIELGCGGTLKKLADQGNEVYCFVGTTSGFNSALSYKTVRDNFTAKLEGQHATDMLGAHLECGDFNTFDLDYSHKLNTLITQLVEKYAIDLVFTHRGNDPHHDHWGLNMAVLHGAKHVKKVLGYQSSWFDAEAAFSPNFFVDISDYWEFKKKLLMCYESEFSRVGEKWYAFCEATSLLYGLKNDCKYAEGFECIRWLL